MITHATQDHLRRAVIPTFLAVALLSSTSTAQNSPIGTTAADLPHRDPDIRWPKAFDPGTAKIFSHNELLIHADCHRVWTRLTDLTDWPNWLIITKDVQILGPDKIVKEGTTAHLLIFGGPISSRITEYVPDSRLAWAPKGDSEAQAGHYHTWRLIPKPTGCFVETEESGVTAEDAKSTAEGNTVMHRAHDLWLASLKWTSEQ